MWRSSPVRTPSPSDFASSGATIEPEPCIDQQAELVIVQGQRHRLLEQAAIDSKDLAQEDRRKSARFHGGPERSRHIGEDVRPILVTKLGQHRRFVCAPDNSEYVEITRQNRLKLASKLRILPRTCQSKTTAAI